MEFQDESLHVYAQPINISFLHNNSASILPLGQQIHSHNTVRAIEVSLSHQSNQLLHESHDTLLQEVLGKAEFPGATE